MIRQLAHLNFVTNDLSKIIDFYVNKLGMRVKFTLNNKAGKPFGYYFECGNSSFLEFFHQAMASEVWGGKVDNSRQAWITDPDGNQIELMEYGPSSLQLTG